MKPFLFIFSLFGAFVWLSLTSVLAEDAPPPPAALDTPAAPAPGVAAGSAVEHEPATPERKHRDRDRNWSPYDRPVFQLGHEAVLSAGEEAEHVVSIFGSTRVDGFAQGNVVAVFGPVFLGSPGKAGGNVVAVLGNVRVDGPVEGNVVSVLGGVELGPKARIDGNVVSVGAPIHADPEAVVQGAWVEAATFPGMPELKGLQAWVRHALLLGRPLALHRDVLWAWGVAGVFLGLYLFIALLMNGALVKCAETLEQRPGKTVLAAFLTVLFTPLLFIVLSITVVGAPLLILAIGVVSLIGKAAFLCWFGRRVTLALGLRHALPAVFVGGILLMMLYLVPFLGFVTMKITDTISVGMVVYTLMLGRREKMATPAPGAGDVGGAKTAAAPAAGMAMGFIVAPPPPPVAPEAAIALDPAVSPMAAQCAAGVLHQQQTSRILPNPKSAVPITSALPRAGFGIRLGALILDALLVSAAVATVGAGELVILLLAVYLIVLWALKGTTIGGIICGLKVVRLDDRPLNWATAVVRGLAGFLSVLPAGLGFLWILFDEEKQSWHDKVAGTVVVHAPKGMSLV